jgi:hypothetical protein
MGSPEGRADPAVHGVRACAARRCRHVLIRNFGKPQPPLLCAHIRTPRRASRVTRSAQSKAPHTSPQARPPKRTPAWDDLSRTGGRASTAHATLRHPQCSRQPEKIVYLSRQPEHLTSPYGSTCPIRRAGNSFLTTHSHDRKSWQAGNRPRRRNRYTQDSHDRPEAGAHASRSLVDCTHPRPDRGLA